MFKTTALYNVGNAYVNDDTGTGTPGTIVDEADQNIKQDELVNAVEQSGQTLDPTGVTRNQLSRAINKPFRTVTAGSDSILVTDRIIFANATGGDVTLSTPSAASMVPATGITVEITIKRIDSSGNKVIVEDIEGDDIELSGNQLPFIRFASDGTTKYLVG